MLFPINSLGYQTILLTDLKISHIRVPVSNYLKTAIFFQKNKSGFNLLTAYEALKGKNIPYYTVVALIPSLLRKTRVYITSNTQSDIDSLTNVFEGAAFPEREAYDLLGIYFQNSHDLRRLLTDYGFKGHPLRKLMPVIGWQDHPVYSFYHSSLKNPGYYSL
jgi:NADH:ubiquinone oxidoreductase subunit C